MSDDLLGDFGLNFEKNFNTALKLTELWRFKRGNDLKKIIASLFLITLVIAAFSFAMFTMPAVKAQAQEAQIVSYSWYFAPNDTASAQYPGDFIVVGEVQNIGSSIIGNLSVVAFAYDSSNTLLSQQANLVFGQDIAPNQKAPFYLDFQPQANSDGTRLDWEDQVSNVTIYTTIPIDTAETQYSGITISGTSGTSTVTGTIKNTGDQAVGDVWVVATYYNSSGTVVGVGHTDFLSTSFQPGASASFSVSPDDSSVVSSLITKYSLTVQSLSVAESATPTPVPTTPQPGTSTTTPTPATSTTTKPTSTPIEISSTTLLYIIIGALIAVIIIIVLAMVLFMRRRKNTPPPTSPPPAPAPSTPPAAPT